MGTKGDVWKYESEYRIIKTDSAKKEFAFPENTISEIIFGCQIDPKSKQEIIEKTKINHPDCKFFQITISKTHLELTKPFEIITS